MIESQRFGMKKRSAQSGSELMLGRYSTAVALITKHRMADSGEVCPYLVGSAGFQPTSQLGDR